jgi:hypothetical protein
MTGQRKSAAILPFLVALLVLLPLRFGGEKAMAENKHAGIVTDGQESTVSYVRIYADAHGDSHFEDVEVPLDLVEVAPGISPLFASAFNEASHYAFLRAEPGWKEDWHPAPQRQFLVYLAGVTEFTVSDGEIRRLGAGTILLAEDTLGRGHISEVVGAEDVVAVLIQVPQEG